MWNRRWGTGEATAPLWKSEDNFRESILPWVPEIKMRSSGLCGKCLYPPIPLTSPSEDIELNLWAVTEHKRSYMCHDTLVDKRTSCECSSSPSPYESQGSSSDSWAWQQVPFTCWALWATPWKFSLKGPLQLFAPPCCPTQCLTWSNDSTAMVWTWSLSH